MEDHFSEVIRSKFLCEYKYLLNFIQVEKSLFQFLTFLPELPEIINKHSREAIEETFSEFEGQNLGAMIQIQTTKILDDSDDLKESFTSREDTEKDIEDLTTQFQESFGNLQNLLDETIKTASINEDEKENLDNLIASMASVLKTVEEMGDDIPILQQRFHDLQQDSTTKNLVQSTTKNALADGNISYTANVLSLVVSLVSVVLYCKKCLTK